MNRRFSIQKHVRIRELCDSNNNTRLPGNECRLKQIHLSSDFGPQNRSTTPDFVYEPLINDGSKVEIEMGQV